MQLHRDCLLKANGKNYFLIRCSLSKDKEIKEVDNQEKCQCNCYAASKRKFSP